jgi:predicted alpha/beta hydrolase family esterase
MKTGALHPTVIICPGNGCNNIRQSNWYGKLHKELTKRKIPCVCENFPDPLNARRDRWIPFIRTLVEKHAKDNHVILVGHSSGSQATLRYTELYPVTASVLVSATYTDLGDASERASGYYPQATSNGGESNPYQFDLMKTNCPTWHQFHSNDDPFIPLHEAERIRDGLGLSSDTYHMLPGRSHFFEFSPELLQVVLDLCE